MKKLLYLLFVLLFLGIDAKSQLKKSAVTPVKYEIKGIVTYFFNDNYGYKPDIGAKAYILKESIVVNKQIQVGKLQAYITASPDPLVKYELLPGEDDPREVEGQAQTAKLLLMTDPETVVVTADGNGVFTKKVAPGNYVVLINSANRTHVNLLEAGGQCRVRRVKVNDDDIEISAQFGL